MLSLIIRIVVTVIGLVLDILTLPLRLLYALLRGARFEFRRFSRRLP